MASHYPQYINPELDKKIRDKFPIGLNRSDMLEDSGRW